MAFSWMALDASSEAILVSTSSTPTAEKPKCPWWFWFIFILLGWFWSFLITDLLLTSSSDVNLLLIPKISTVVPKYHLNVSATFLFSETTFPPETTLSFELFYHCRQLVREKKLYKFPKLFIIRNISCIEVIKIFFLSFSNYYNTNISQMFCCKPFLHSWDFAIKNVLRNLERVIIAFCTSLVMKEDWLFLNVFC